MFDTIRMGAAGAGGAYEIERSLRFNSGDSTKLSHTPSSSGNLRTWTFSFWCKRSKLGTRQDILSPYRSGVSGSNEAQIMFTTDAPSDQFRFYGNGGASGYPLMKTTRRFRDTNAWYHIVLAYDSTQGTASDRVNIYVNGVKETAFDNESYGDQNQQLGFMRDQANYIGAYGYDSGASNFFDGYLAEMHWVDGTQLTAASFGEEDTDTGAWIPKEYTGSHGTAGFYLNFSDNSNTTSSTLGDDDSANTNDWTPTNFVTGDSVIDTPTNNFATIRMLRTPYASGASITDGNLRFISGSGTGGGEMNKAGISTMLVNSGKWYAEFYSISGTSTLSMIGVQPYEDQVGGGTDNSTLWGVKFGAGDVYIADHVQSYPNNYWTHGSAGANGDVTMVYFDMDVSPPRLYTGKNGQWADGSGNDDESSPNAYLSLVNNFLTHNSSMEGYLGFRLSSGGSAENVGIIANFGQDSTFAGSITAGTGTDANGYGNFKYAPPTGALALCSQNLPDPTIKDSTDNFNVVLWTGNDADDRSIPVGFQPAFTWIKNYAEGSTGHYLYDAERGATKYLHCYAQDAEQTGADSLQAFESNGFQIGTNSDHNGNGKSFMSWNWEGGSSGSGATSGSGTAKTYTSDYNATAGFSVTKYIGNNTAGHTIPHSLGVAPEFIVVKRTDSSDNWIVYHKSIGNNYYLEFNETSQKIDNTFFNDTTPTSSVFSVGSDASVNANDATYIAYLFSTVEGYSRIGMYRGNGNDDGMFVYTGFKPAAIIIKRTDASEDWWMWDNERNKGNPIDKNLYVNEANAQADEDSADFLSNGFKLRLNNVNWNASGGTYIFLAFAETPFKYATAR